MKVFDKVRVRKSWLFKLLSFFGLTNQNLKFSGQVGTVLHIEKGKYSKDNLYTIAFDDFAKKIGCFFEDELEIT